MMWGDHWMFGGFMWLFWIAILVGIFLLIKWAIQQGRSENRKPDESALEILQKRYARGEIDKEEFEQMKKDLVS